jgi:hypothetical protein
MSVDKKNKSIPFSENVVFGGNFKQTITVVTKGISVRLLGYHLEGGLNKWLL